MLTTAAEVPTPAEPDGAPRLAVLDILRGIAILGILFMNINDMGGSVFRSAMGEARGFGWSSADQVAWWMRAVFADGTARCLLEMLFGVGMVILTDRAITRMNKWQVMRAYWVRNIVLFLFGVIHIVILLWPGDILHTYGLAALLAVLFRRWRPGWLLTAGLFFGTLQLVAGGGYIAYTQTQRTSLAAVEAKQRSGQALSAAERTQLANAAKTKAERDKSRAENDALIRDEDRARTGSARSWTQSAWDATWYMQSRFLEILFVWEALSTMLIGAALYKLGIIQGARSRRFYAWLLAGGYGVGLTCRAWSAAVTMRFDHSQSVVFASQELARVATTLGHVALVNLLVLSVAGARVLKPFEAAGRTALTLYIAQTLICLWVLYPPWGLALYGQQGWAAMMLTALAVNAVLLWAATWWVKHYAMAPVEWAWRSTIAGRALPFRLRGGERGGVAVAV